MTTLLLLAILAGPVKVATLPLFDTTQGFPEPTNVTLDVGVFPFPPTEHVIIANMGRPLFTCDAKCAVELRKCLDMNCQRCAWLRSTEREVKAVACCGGSATTR